MGKPIGGALSRFKVLDLSHVRAGPTCVKQLADFGADVIKIEAPTIPGRREPYTGPRDLADMQNLHRNKRSIVLDLKKASGLATFMKLVETADVVVENYRPDVKHRLGVDYESLKKVNPRIVLASISGFGQEGPYSKRPGFDQVLQGMSGLMSVTGKAGGGPIRAGAAVIDVSAGLYAALGVLTALLEREESGQGQWVQSSLLHAGIALMDFQAARWLVDGIIPVQVGNDHPTSMPTSAYPTSDGYINIGAGNDAMWKIVCQVTGTPDNATKPEFLTSDDRVKNRDLLNQTLSDLFSQNTKAYWIEALNTAGVPCGPIYSMDEVFADEQVKFCGIAESVENPRRGTIQLVAQAAKLSRTPASIRTALGPKGEHTDEVLREFGFDNDAIAKLRADAAI
jgi:crotonobetainyl-CoA:carnitine CoA-transferase CaiB-like acyl-CoA transferase